jgi:translation initiation factor IF-2
MFDENGRKIKEATPSTPVSILGIPEVPSPGDIFEVVKSKKEAEALVTERKERQVEPRTRATAPMTLEDFLSRLEGEEVKELNLIVKADVQGSLEPVVNSLKNLGDDQHKVKIILEGTGNISESDVTLAIASNAIVIGFNVQVDEAARRIAEAESIEIRIYRVIYELVESIELALKGLYEPVYEERILGHAEVRATFRVGKKFIAGCYVTEGKIVRNALVRVARNRELLHTSSISSLRRFVEDVEEVAAGYECGVGVEGFNSFVEGDILEAYLKERIN